MLERLHRHLTATASSGREVIEVAPFLVTIDRGNPLRFFNYAIPAAGATPTRVALDALVDVFRARDRLPRLEWIEEVAPGLAGCLDAAGFEQELRTPLMACTAGELLVPPLPIGIAIGALRDEDLDERDALVGTAFGDPPRPPGVPVRDPRQRGGGVRVAHLGGELAGTASHSAIVEGVAEIAGVATRERFRRRGIAGALTAAASRAAFAAGAELCVLTPGHEAAQRIYAAAGYTPLATMLHWSLPARPETDCERKILPEPHSV